MAMKLKKIYIEITNACNLHCSFCAANHREPRFMQMDQFRHILGQIKPYTRYIYLHVLGEPLLHPDIDKLLQISKQEGFYVNITSNAILLPQHVFALIHHVRQLNISLHSYRENSEVHGKDYLNECLRCGDILAENGTYVSYRFWNRRNKTVDATTKHMLSQIAHHYETQITTDAKQTLAKRRFLHFEDLFAWPSLQLPYVGMDGACYGLRTHCAILADGSVVPCCLDAEGVMTLGNIFETSFCDIMNRQKTKRIIEGFRNGVAAEGLCQHCTYRKRFD